MFPYNSLQIKRPLTKCPQERQSLFSPPIVCIPHPLSPDPNVNLTEHLATHFPIAMYAIKKGLHVLVTKPAVKLLSEHLELVEAARKHNVVCMVEHHKR